MKKKLLGWLATVIFGLAVILTVLGVNGVFEGGLAQLDLIRFVCDAFFAAGVLVMGIGALVWCSDKGSFDGLKFGMTSFFRLHFSTKRYDWQEKEDYAAYKERIHGGDKKKSHKSWLIIGGVFLAVSLIVLIVYYTY